MEPQNVHIPTNFTDAGKILGMFEIRNTVEALILIIPVILIFFVALPLSLTAKIISGAVVIVPVAGFALIGIRDYSLITFIKIYFQWRKARRILTYRGEEKS